MEGTCLGGESIVVGILEGDIADGLDGDVNIGKGSFVPLEFDWICGATENGAERCLFVIVVVFVIVILAEV